MKFILIPILTICICSSSYGVTTLIEANEGEFSDDFSNPTAFNLMNGVNILQFTIGGGFKSGEAPNGTGGATNGSDADFIFFNIPDRSTLTSIRVTANENGSHFFGAQFGTTFAQQPINDRDYAKELDGQRLFSEQPLERELLIDPFNPDQSLKATKNDFVAFFQETGPNLSSVTLSVTVVPEPSALLLLSLASLAFLRRKRD